MPKRGYDSLEFIVEKLRKLEKAVKRSRHEKRNGFRLSSSSSSSSSSPSSREPTPEPPEENSQDPPTDPSPNIETIDLESQPNAAVTVALDARLPEDAAAPVVADKDEAQASMEILDILGEDPSITVEYGAEINQDVANRFSHISTTGLNKDVHKDLVKKYIIPENCKNIAAPQLNIEIKAALGDQVLKRDKAIEARQKRIAAGISALGKIISDQLNAKDKNNELIKNLMDVGRIFCDVQYLESEARRNFALYSVKKDLKDQLSTTKVDKYLFGNNLTETLKTAKAISKSSSDLKIEPPKISKVPSASTSKNLNWKARTQVRRQPLGPAPRPPPPAAPSAPPRGNSSQGYTQRPKQTRRR